MDFKYCPACGAPLAGRPLGDEGMVPWCERCSKPWFPMFPIATITLVHDEEGKVLMLRQSHISREYWNLVSGYIKPGEDAEQTAVREIMEETGQVVDRLEIKMTRWFPYKQMLMIGFFAEVRRRPLSLSVEVDDAAWQEPEDILRLVSSRPGSTARALCELYAKSRK